jgi:hypothetical protein
MHDTRLVRRGETAADGDADFQRAVRRDRAALERPRERLAVDVFHGQVATAAMLADIEGARDVGVRHPAGQLHLLSELLERICAGAVPAQELERHHLVELAIEDAIDAAHTAHAEKSEEQVSARDELLGHFVGPARGGRGGICIEQRCRLAAGNLLLVLAHSSAILARLRGRCRLEPAAIRSRSFPALLHS